MAFKWNGVRPVPINVYGRGDLGFRISGSCFFSECEEIALSELTVGIDRPRQAVNFRFRCSVSKRPLTFCMSCAPVLTLKQSVKFYGFFSHSISQKFWI